MSEHASHNKEPQGHPLLIIALAILIVAGLSLVPWGRLTGHAVKDFSLLSDLTGIDHGDETGPAAELVDPDLIAEMESGELADSESTDAEQSEQEEPAARIGAAPSYRPAVPADEASPRIDGEMVIEDYTDGSVGLASLKNALADGRQARIAVIGDSYIEGDILTQDIRRLLQDQYGGRGVGYMPAHSQVSGFRQTVRQSDNGWNHITIQRASGSKYFTIMGEYFRSDSVGASVTYKGTKKLSHLGSWNRSTVLFIAPYGGTVSMTTDNGQQDFQIEASEDVQAIVVEGETSSLKFHTSIPGLIFLGAYADDTRGIAVDCMSIRGDSGISHRKVNPDLAEQLREWVDYDLIVLEYGINALTSDRFDYSGYTKLMAQVVDRLRQCYPNAQILIMGIGDRGQKIDGEVHSLPSAQYMVAAQRKLARDTGCLFWDTREAMGGDDAVVDWRDHGLVNGDYIHLNSKGGAVLASEFVKSITAMLSND